MGDNGNPLKDEKIVKKRRLLIRKHALITKLWKKCFIFLSKHLLFGVKKGYNRCHKRKVSESAPVCATLKGMNFIMAKRILLVDDEPLIIKGLKYSLEQDGYETDSAADGEEAINKFFAGNYDLILLDVMLPKMSGIEVCQRIRERSYVPIIMLTAKGEDMDKILGLEYGADDYMTKPFNILEVKARIKSIFRRAAAAPEQEEKKFVRVRDLEVNFANRSVTLSGKDVKLTAKEFDLLQLFITNRGKVYSREDMLATVWKYDYLGDMRTVDVHIRRLREKIERDTSHPEFIFTKWGVGYYFTDKD